VEKPSPTILLFYIFFAGTRSPSSNQSFFPSRKSLNLPSERGKFTLATLNPPLSSSLIYFPFLQIFNPREVPAKRCFGFLVIPGFKDIANMERYPEMGSIGYLAIKAE
jgi:hypothetical protein